MNCSVFIACSVDGFIAKKDGNIDFLTNSVDPTVDLGEDADMGFDAFLETVDCLVMGRKTMEIISSFNLKDEEWPYGKRKIIVLSKSLDRLPENVKDKMELYKGGIESVLEMLANQGKKNAYIDGGSTIRSFLEKGLINEMILTRIPVLLGEGISLFEGLKNEISLKTRGTKKYANGCIQEVYSIV